MDQGLLIALISAGSAVVASVAAQLIGGWLNRRQLREQLAWDRRKWADEQEQQANALHVESLRSVYTDVLTGFENLVERVFTLRQKEDIRREQDEDLNTRAGQIYRSCELTYLYSPTTARQIRDTLEIALDWIHDSDKDIALGPAGYVKFSASIDILRATMRRDLGLAKPDDALHNRPQLNEATMNGTTKTLDTST